MYKKIIVSIIVIGCLLTASLVNVNASIVEEGSEQIEVGECTPIGNDGPDNAPNYHEETDSSEAVLNPTNADDYDIYVDDDAPNDPGPNNPGVSDPFEDGTEDHPFDMIQEGVDAAEDGDTVYVFNGVYYEHIVIDKLINLIGENKDTTIIDGGAVHYVKVVQIKSSGVSIRGFTIQIGGLNNILMYIFPGCNGNTITGNTIKSKTYKSNNGIYLSSSSSNTITGNTIKSLIDGICLSSSSNNIITSNTLKNNNDAGIDLSSSSNNIITSNTLKNNEDWGIYLHSSSNNTITGNTISGGWMVIYLSKSSGNILTGNTISGGTHGLYSIYSDGNTITGNTIPGCEIAGIELRCSQNNNISNNILHGIMFDAGIALDDQSTNNIITGNTITRGVGMGIHLDSSSVNTISGNIINSRQYSILITDSSNNIITSNTIAASYSGICGIYLSSSSGNTITGNTIKELVISGIDLYSSSGNTIVGNIISASDEGITLEYQSTNNIITGNTIMNAADYGICLDSSNDNTIGGDTGDLKNIIKDNYIGIKIQACEYYRDTLLKHNIFDNNTRDIWGAKFGYDQSTSQNNPVSKSTVGILKRLLSQFSLLEKLLSLPIFNRFLNLR